MSDDFDLPADVDDPANGAGEDKYDPKRPKTVRGRYPLPHPVTGKAMTWQRVSNLIKMAEDTYHLELWERRNVAKGLSMRPDYVETVQRLDVKADRDQLNKICERSKEIAGAYRMSDEGTKLHKSTELVDFADGDLTAAPDRHHAKVRLYLDALMANGLEVVPGMIERTVVSTNYEVAGTFDRIFLLGDGSYVLGDVKSGDSLDLSMPSISGQLDCYRDGINTHGIWDGSRYDDRIKVRDDFALVVHIPSTRDEVSVHEIDLAEGAAHNKVCLDVRARRRVKAKHVSRIFQPDAYRARGVTVDQSWLELGNAAHTVDELIEIAVRARGFGQWNQRLSDQFRMLARELSQAQVGMGS